MHLYRLRTLYRNGALILAPLAPQTLLQGTSMVLGRYRCTGRHLYRLRSLKRWIGAKWVHVRSNWHLYRRNCYNHRLHGRTRWSCGSYRRIGVHLYRHRKL